QVALGVRHRASRLQTLEGRLLDARGDALAADVEGLRVLPGGDADGLEGEVVLGDVGEGQHQQALGEDAHLLPAEGEGVALRDGERGAGARLAALPCPALRASALATPAGVAPLPSEGLDERVGALAGRLRDGRSEEHTSELQSRANL